MRRVKDKRTGTVLKVSDQIAEMVLKDPDIVEVDESEPESKSAKRPAKTQA